jgi:copper oxidase (laccase) domain-containing protein
MSTATRAATALGESALTGWRGAVGRAVARPVAKRTRFTEEQIRAAIGLALIAWAVFQIIRTAVRAANRL